MGLRLRKLVKDVQGGEHAASRGSLKDSPYEMTKEYCMKNFFQLSEMRVWPIQLLFHDLPDSLVSQKPPATIQCCNGTLCLHIKEMNQFGIGKVLDMHSMLRHPLLYGGRVKCDGSLIGYLRKERNG